MRHTSILLVLFLLLTISLGALPPHIQDGKDRDAIISFLKANEEIAVKLIYIDLDEFRVYSSGGCVTSFSRAQRGRRRRRAPEPGPAGTLSADKTVCDQSLPEKVKVEFMNNQRLYVMRNSRFEEKNWEFSYETYDDAVAQFRVMETTLGKYEYEFYFHFAELLFKVGRYEEARKYLDRYFHKTSLRGVLTIEAFKLWFQCEKSEE